MAAEWEKFAKFLTGKGLGSSVAGEPNVNTEERNMLRRILGTLCCLLVASVAGNAQEAKEAPKPSPAEGYNIHVLAPHLVDGKQMGPYHHYCKVVAPDPQIVCLIFESTEPNANLVQVEWIYAKKLTRTQVPLKEWNSKWHDHKIEIAGGRVQVR